jgi:hypothetical protein
MLEEVESVVSDNDSEADDSESYWDGEVGREIQPEQNIIAPHSLSSGKIVL